MASREGRCRRRRQRRAPIRLRCEGIEWPALRARRSRHQRGCVRLQVCWRCLLWLRVHAFGGAAFGRRRGEPGAAGCRHHLGGAARRRPPPVRWLSLWLLLLWSLSLWLLCCDCVDAPSHSLPFRAPRALHSPLAGRSTPHTPPTFTFTHHVDSNLTLSMFKR